MAGNIKGITIEIDGNTKKLNTALKSVNQDLKDTQYKLKDVEKGLKLNPGNTELLQQKFKLLGTAVDEAKQKLNLLEDAEKQAAQQLQNRQIGQDEYDALKLKIVAAREEVARLQKAYDDFGSVSAQKIAEAGKQVEEFGGKVATVGDGLTKGVTAPLMAIGGAGIAAFKELDTAMDTVTTKTGASGEALKDMQDRAKNIAETIPTDFQTAADAVGEVNTRFGATGDELEDLSSKFVKFAEINNTDVSTSIDSVQSVMAAWGVSTEDAGLLLDTLTKAGQDTGVSVEKLSDDLAANKTALDEMGFSVSDSATFLANLDKNGVDASSTLAGLKKALVNASKEGKSSKEALGELEDTIKNSSSSTEAYQKAIELFGAKSGPAIADAVREGRLSFDELGTSLEDFAGTTENTFNETLDPIDQLTTALNTTKDIGAELGGTILEVLNPAMQKLNDFVKEARDKWNKLSPKTKDAIVKFGLIAAAIGPIMSTGGRLIKGVGKLMKLAPKLGSAISFLMSPMGLVVLAIGAAIVIGVALYKNWDTIKAKAQALGDKLKAVWDGIKNWTKQTWDNIKTTISGAVDNVKQKVSQGWDTIKQNTTQKWTDVKNSISAKWDEIKNNVSTKLSNLKTSISQGWDNVKSNAAAKWSEIKNNISAKWDEIKTNVSAKADAVKNTVSAKWGEIKTNASAKWGEIKTAIGAKWDEIKTNVSGKVDALKNSISGKWDEIKNSAGSKLSDIKNKIAKPFEDAKLAVSNAINNIKRLFPISLGSIFSNIKLPHFRVSGGKAPWGIGGKGSLPKFSVSWYKKAYDNAVMFNDPTVLPTTSGYKGFGDGNGSEIVMGKEYMLNMIREAIGGSQLARNMGAVGQILSTYLPEIATKEMRVSGQDLVYANSQNINRTLGAETVLTGRGVR